MSDRWTFAPLTPERWRDFEALFGDNGACGGCWCMFWRLARSRFNAGRGAGNRAAMRMVVNAGPPPGVLAYDGATPVGWCAVAPREQYPALARSRTLKPLDDRPVWSVSCFFIRRDSRRRGLSAALANAAAELAISQGATIVEGYPNAPGKRTADPFVWTGLVSSFTQAGFVECARPTPSRRIVRRGV